LYARKLIPTTPPPRYAQAWLKIDRQHGPFAGIALTGRQREDHFSGLCELLPTSIPSLALVLAILQHGCFSPRLHTEVAVGLGFTGSQQMPLRPLPASSALYVAAEPLLHARPSFAGAAVWMAVIRLEVSQGLFEGVIDVANIHPPITVHLLSLTFPARFAPITPGGTSRGCWRGMRAH